MLPMKLGLLADIHEHTRQLQKAIAVLQRHGAERFVVLGDVFETGKRIERTVRPLEQVQAVGVWGNHDVGLCFDPDEKVCQRYSATVLNFMGSLQPPKEQPSEPVTCFDSVLPRFCMIGNNLPLPGQGGTLRR